MNRIPLSIGDQAAALSRDWNHWLASSSEARKKAALLMRTSRAMSEPRSDLLPSILKVMATRPRQWWQAGDIVAPLAALGWIQTATQIGHALRRAHQRSQIERDVRNEGRRVLYRVGGAP